MNKLRVGLAAVAVLALSVAPFLAAAEDQPGENVKCPISGKAVKADATAEYKGKTVYFCCNNCPKAFAKDPEKHAAKAGHQLALTGQAVQVACPISGKPINPDTAIEVEGEEVAFCCKHCEAKVKGADADGQITFCFANLDKGFTTQVKCPISGKAINPAASVEYKGKKVYFCCENCPKAFEKDPAKYESKL